MQAVTVSMQLASSEEVRRVEKGMSWLATTAGVTPFIGLFGTVWGIIDAFSGLGTSGSASLRAVAPGIAEALVTTAAGLFAAIPALIAYNYFLQDIRDLAQRLDTFALEFAAQIEKTFTMRDCRNASVFACFGSLRSFCRLSLPKRDAERSPMPQLPNQRKPASPTSTWCRSSTSFLFC